MKNCPVCGATLKHAYTRGSRGKAVAYLRRRKRPASPSEVASALGMGLNSTMHLLRDAEQRGECKRIGRGMWVKST